MPWPVLTLAASAALVATAPDPVIAALTRCIRSAEAGSVGPGPSVVPPPGLLDDRAIAVSVAGSANAFAYEGRRGPSCGVALYGRVPATMRHEIETVVASVPGWRPFDPAPIPTAAPGREIGWGDLHNPTMYGAVLYERRPSATAPTIDVMRYAVLVQ